MIGRDGPLSVSRRCALVGVSRSSLYYRPKGESAENLALMRRLDELHMAYPFYGSRQLMRHLRREGVTAGRHRIRRLMRLTGMEATYRRPRTSVASPQHRIFPYLLRGLTISRADHVWCADITYVPVTRGFSMASAVGQFIRLDRRSHSGDSLASDPEGLMRLLAGSRRSPASTSEGQTKPRL